MYSKSPGVVQTKFVILGAANVGYNQCMWAVGVCDEQATADGFVKAANDIIRAFPAGKPEALAAQLAQLVTDSKPLKLFDPGMTEYSDIVYTAKETPVLPETWLHRWQAKQAQGID